MLSMPTSYWPILVAAAINMVIGAVWYSPILFGKAWSKLLGQKMSDMQKNAAPGYSVSLVGALIQAFVLATLLHSLGVTTALIGAWTALLLWLGFVLVTTAPDTVFSGRPWKLLKINTAYYLVVLLINGVLLAVWR